MASLVLGGIGGFLFGPIGFAIGSALGSLLTPPEKSEGPRLTDKHMQGSTYGEPIPLIYGTMRLSGQIIWAPDLVEHKHKSGGKGGPQVTTYTYTGSFDVLICESNDGTANKIAGCVRIWADGTLIYDTTGATSVDNSQVPVTFYFGDETQLPDPTEEAVLGVGNVPAYRGYCRAVFTDWDLGTYGNRYPQLSFEVFSKAGPYPWQVSVGVPWHDQPPVQFAGFTLTAGVLTAFYSGPADDQYNYAQFDVQTLAPVAATVLSTVGGFNQMTARPLNGLGTPALDPPGTIAWVTPDAMGVAQLGLDVSATNFFGSQPGVVLGDNYYCANSLNPFYMNKFAFGGGFINRVSVDMLNSNGISLGIDPLNNEVYAISTNVGSAKMWRFDADLNLLQTWLAADLAGTKLTNGAGGSFVVYKGQVAFNYNSAPTIHWIGLVDINTTNQTATDSVHGPLTQGVAGGLAYLGNGLVVNQNYGVFSLEPPQSPVILGEIVADISLRSGLVSSQYPDLPGSLPDLVPGFMISRQSTGRDNIMQLRTAYFFDGVESSAAMKFVKRGNAPVITIPDNDLAAQTGGRGTPPPLATVERTQETDLPATMYVSYFNTGADWQNGTQYSRRLVTQSKADARADLSIALDDLTARSISAKLLWASWLERNKITILTSRKYAYLEPTDVISAHGYTMRADGKSNVQSGIVQFNGVTTAYGPASVFKSNAPVGVPTSGDPTITPPSAVASAFELHDIALVQDTDAANGFYAAMYPVVSGTWPGGTVYESSDGGSTYNSVGSDSSQDIVGTVAVALGNFQSGNIFDESNSIGVLLTNGGTLASASRDAVLNGANAALVGSEIVQFRTATLTAPNTYTLTGLLRGRRGTDVAIAGHGASERFTLLPMTINVAAPFAELGAARLFKGITTGGTLSGAIAQTFTNNGVALKCYAPVQLGGGRDAAGDITLAWTRRTRTGGAWLNFTDVPIGELSETYAVNIYSASYAALVHTIYVGLEGLDYLAADQTADFGGLVNPLYWGVAQVGAYGNGYETRAIT